MIAGCRRFGAAAPDREILGRLAVALRPDGGQPMSHATSGEAGMAQAAGASMLRKDALLVAWDGRLDNHADVECSLGAERGTAVAELLAQAYARWGPRFPARIVGDFALALWDDDRRRLVLARDPFGVRPLFYAARRDDFVWASSLRALRASGVDLGDVDEGWIAGYFARSIAGDATPWRGARAVPPGCALIVEGERPRTECCWSVEDVRPVHHASDADYEEGFRRRFFAAVRRRLPSDAPATAELSGGLDSSSIVCAADHLLATSQVESPGLFTVSYVYDRSRSADERAFIREVEAHVGRRTHQVLESESRLLSGLAGASLEFPSGMACFREFYRAVFAHMDARGSRVLLSGIGGDNLLTSQVGAPLQLADSLRTGRLRQTVIAARRWRREQGKPYLHLLWDGGLVPLLPRPLRLRLVAPSIPLAPWLTATFVRRQALRARAVAAVDPAGDFPQPSKREQVGAVRSAIRAVTWRYEWWDHPVRVAYPFLDRDLVEFCLSAPSEQFVRGAETRSLHRRALAGLLPARIVRRRDKRGPDEAILRAMADGWGEISALLENPRVAARGWIDPVALRAAAQDVRFGKVGDSLLALLTSLALEAWLRAIEEP